MSMESEWRNDAPIVTLSDDVVVLRPWSAPDARFIADASSDPGIQRYSSPPRSVTDAVALIESFERSWRRFAERGRPSGVSFAILDAASGDLAGQCGVDEWSSADVAQIGYWLAPHARGRGFATRAVKLMTSWLFELGAARVFLNVVTENARSAAVARRAGFAYEGTLRSHGVWQGTRCDIDVFAVLPHEWAVRRET
jgi:RimJ/RimL family protein N-acetyltransferase